MPSNVPECLVSARPPSPISCANQTVPEKIDKSDSTATQAIIVISALTKRVSLGLLVALISPCIALAEFADAYRTNKPASALDVAQIQSAINAAGAKWVAGENAITRLSPEERRMRLLTEIDRLTKFEPRPLWSPNVSLSLPLSLDWRNNGGSWITPVRDQGNGPYCSAFTATAALESATLRANNTPGIDLDLSEQVLISCSDSSSYEGACDYIKDHGLPVESCYPYTASTGSCSSACTSSQSAVYKIYDWHRVTDNLVTDPDLLKAALLYGPVMVTMMVYTDFFSYNGGIYSYVSGILEGGHSVLLIGYNDAAQYFVAKNSWGTNWGEGGFFRIAYNQVSGFSQVKFGDYAALVTVNPSLCLTTVSAAGESGIVEQNLSAAGTTGTLYITTSSNSCAWTVVSNVPWIEISSQSSGTGSALVSFTVAPNPNADSRNGTITIANYRLTVNQKGTAPEPYVLAAKLPLNGDVAPGVAVDRLGNVYVAEMLYNKIVKFDPQGSFVTNWGSCGTGDGQFTNPYGIAIDPSGYVYVADLSFNRIQKFDSQGNFVKVMGAHSTRSVAVDGSGYIYYSDMCLDNIVKLDPSGLLVAKWGSRGSGDGQFNGPREVAVDPSGYVYVYDSSNFRIQKFDTEGRFLSKWGSYGLADGQFMGLENSLGIDNLGSVYVVDSVKYNIQKFDNHGNLIAKWSSRGSADGQISWWGGVAVDPSGFVYVGDAGRIQKFVKYVPGCYTLSKSANPEVGGSVTVNTAINCAGGYTSGTAISLTATPATNYVFSSWTGSGGTFSNSSAASTTFAISGNASVTANFTYVPPCYTLSKSANPSGGGSVTVNTASNCTGGYTSGTAISLTATPATNYVFSSWTGSGGTFSNSSSAYTTFTISGNASVTANFTLGPPGAAVLLWPSGSIPTPTPAFSWNAVPGSTWYYLRVNDANTSPKILRWYTSQEAGCPSDTGTCSVSSLAVLAQGAAQWWIETWNDYGYGPWSSGMAFTVSGNLPGATTLISPSGTVSTNSPAYVWNAVPNASWYYLWVTDAGASPKIVQWYTAEQAGCVSGMVTCSVSSPAVSAQGAAQWWIQTWNDAGYGPWSQGMTFSVSGSLPGMSTLVSPSGKISTKSPTYTWNLVPNATYYYLWVNDSTGTKVATWYTAAQAGCASGTGTCSATPSVTLASGAAQWWIQTWNPSGYGPWSTAIALIVP